MKKKRRPIAYRLIAFVLAFAMIFTSISFSDVGSIDAKAAEAEGWYWDGSDLYIKDGSISGANFIKAVQEKTGSTLSTVYYSTSNLRNAAGFRAGGTQISSGTTYTSFAHDTTYYASTYSRSGLSVTGTVTGDFTVKHYYDITARLADGSPTEASVTPATQRVIKGDSANLTITEVMNYNVTVTDSAGNIDTLTETDHYNYTYTPTVSTTLTVEYVEATKPQHNVTLNVIGDDFGDASLTATGQQYEETEITLTATPGTNGYISSIDVAGAEATISDFNSSRGKTGTFSVGTSDITVTVTFAQKELAQNSTIGTVGYYASMTEDLLKQNIYQAVVDANASLPNGLTWDKLTYEFYPYQIIDWYIGGTTEGYQEETEALTYAGENSEVAGTTTTKYAFASRWLVDGSLDESLACTEKVKITWPATEQYPEDSISVEVKLVEGREKATINYTKPAEVEFEEESEIEAAILAAASSNSSNPITATRVTDTLPTGGNTATLTYKLAVATDANYLANEIEVEIDVKAKSNPAIVNITINGEGTVELGSLSASGTLSTGTYTFTADPTNATGYVASVTVNGTEIGNDISKYTDQVFADSVTVVNDNTYEVVVTFAERSLVLTEKTSISVNGYNTDTIKATYISEITADNFVDYDSCAGGTASASNCIVRLQYREGVDTPSNIIANHPYTWWGYLDAPPETKTLEIEWTGDARYPTVKTTRSVSVVEKRTEANINYTPIEDKEVTVGEETVTVFEFNEVSEILTAVQNATTFTSADKPTVALNGDAPSTTIDGQVQTVTYTATVAESATTLGGTLDITVKVMGEVHQPSVVITETTDNGIVSVTDGTNEITGGKVSAGKLYVTITPKEGYHVESVVLKTSVYKASDDTTSTDSANQSLTYSTDGKHVGSCSFEITNGDYDAEKTYEIIVTYGKRVITEKETYDEVFYNATWDYAEHKDVFLANAYDAIVETGTTPEGTVKTVELIGADAPVVGQKNTIKITWEATDKYPEVSITREVTVTENRSPAVITVTPVSAMTVDGDLSVVVDAVKANTTVSEGALAPSFELLDTTAPNQSEEITVRVKVSVAENDTWLAAEDVIVEVPVKGAVHKSTVTIAEYDTTQGSVVVTTPSGTEVVSGEKYFAGDLTITVDPNGNYYVDSVTVQPKNTADDALATVAGTYSETVFTGSYTIDDGTGLEADDLDNSYEIIVVFKERTLALTDKTSILINGYSSGTRKDTYISEITADNFVDYENCIGGTANASNVEVLLQSAIGDYTPSVIVEKCYNVATAYDQIFDAPATDGSTVTKTLIVNWSGDDKYPAVSKTISVSVVEQRTAPNLVDAELGAIEYVNTSELDTYMNNNVSTFNPDGLSVSYSYSGLPTECNETGIATCTVSFAGNETYVPGTCTVTFDVTLKASKCNIVAGTNANGTISGTGEVDGLTDVKLTVTPNDKYAIDTIKVTAVNEKTGETSEFTPNPTYSKGVASFEFRTDGSNGSVTYTVNVTYVQTEITIKSGQAINYCYEQKTDGAILAKWIYDAVYSSKKPDGLPINSSNAVVEYAYVGAFGYNLWAEVGAGPSFDVSGVTHHFGVKGTETVRISYTDDRYGTITSNEVVLNVFDACYNTDITVVENPAGHKGTVDISTDDAEETKNDKDGNTKYKEGTEYTVTVAPGNGNGNDAVTSAEYVESIVVTDKDGKVVETSALKFTKAGEIFGISYNEPTAKITFTTGKEADETNSDYTITVTYKTAAYAVVEDAVNFDKYDGVEGVYETEIPTAEEIFAAVIDEANTLPAVIADYENYKEHITVEYSTDGSTYKSLDTLGEVADGSTVTIKITYDDPESLQYRPVYVTKEVTLKDPRTATAIDVNEDAITEEIEYVEYETVAAEIKELLAPVVNAGEKQIGDIDDVAIDVTQPYTMEGEEGKIYVDATFTYDGTAYVDGVGYKPSTITVTGIPVKDLPANCTVDVVSSMGTVEIVGQTENADGVYEFMGNTSYDIVVTPNAGYVVDAAVLKTIVDGEVTATVDVPLTHKDRVATGEIKVTEKETYLLVASYVEQKFTFKEEAERVYAFKFGIDDPSDPDQIVALYNSVVENPVHDTASTTPYSMDVRYLAREAGKQTVYIPKLAAYGITIYEGGDYTFDMEELWLVPGTEIKNVDLNDEIAKIEEMFQNINGLDDAKMVLDYVNDFMDRLPTMQIGAHQFAADGDGAVETICLSYDNEKYVINSPINTADASSITTVKIQDSRIDTMIAGADASVTYGATEAEIYEALGIDVVVTESGASTGETAAFGNKVAGLNASDTPYQVIVNYGGNADYQPATATFNLTVTKAPCEIDYDSQIVKYGTPYEFELVKNPEDVDTIDLMIGLDMEAMSVDNLMPVGYIHVRMPGLLGSMFQAETTLQEFLDQLGTLATSGSSLLDGLGIDPSTIQTVINTINSATEGMENVGDIKVKVNGDDFKPDNVGVYLAGAVTADSNYETAYTLDFLVIYPDGTKAELDWRFEDANGIITKSLIEDKLYDLGADAFVADKFNQDATDVVQHLFLKLDVEGNFDLVRAKSNDDIYNHLEDLTETGAYTQLSMVADWGNTMYYSAPIIRAYVVIPEIVNVTIVDENGNENNDRIFTYDGTPHGVQAVVTDSNGDRLSQEEHDQYLTITYYGYSLNSPTEIYNSTTPPTDAGAYTALALFADKEGDRYGADIAAIAIQPADASLKVENQSVMYGSEYDLGITVDPEDCKYISIVAGIDAGGQISSENLNPLSGTVNIDLPVRLDRAFKEIMPEAYEGGVTANELLAELDKLPEKLGEYGFPEEAVNTIQSVLDMIPESELGTQLITFNDNVVPENVGLYMVGAVTCDPNYTFAADLGYLIVQPDATKVDLAFNYEDANNIFTLNYIKSGALDLGSHVVKTDSLSEEDILKAEEQLVNLYIGVTGDGSIVTSTSPILAHGVYTQFAFLDVDSLNEFYYAEPIMRTYVVIGETVDVQFVDESGAENADRLFTYDGQPHEMDVKVTHNNGTDLSDTDGLTVTYLGYDAKGIQIYNSTTPPTNVGAYTVVAVYSDTEADLFGMAIGAMVIQQAESELTVPELVVEYGTDYEYNITSVPEDLDYISILGGISVKGEDILENGVESVTGTTNVDFPDYMDEYIKKVLPSAYTEEGIVASEVKAALDKVKDVFEQLGLDPTVMDEVISIIDGMTAASENVVITFHEFEDVKPTEVGVYAVSAVSVDLNYKLAVGAGYIAIVPDVLTAELKFNQDFEQVADLNVLYIDEVEDFDFGVTGTFLEDGSTIADEFIDNYYVGVTAEGESYASIVAPTELGTYVQYAGITDLGSQTYIAVPLVRQFTIALRYTAIEVSGDRHYVYDGQQHGFDVKLVDIDGNEITGETIDIKYVGADGDIEIYNSPEWPTAAGVYELVAVYEGSDKYLPAIGNKTLIIEPRKLVIQFNDVEKLVGDPDPAFTYTILEGLVPGDAVSIAGERTEGEAVGTYEINHSLMDVVRNLNYEIDSHNGTLTIKKRDLVVKLEDKQVTYGDAEADLTYKVEGPVLGGDVVEDFVVIEDLAREAGTAVGTYPITAAAHIGEGTSTTLEMTYVDMYNVTVEDAAYEIVAKDIADTSVVVSGIENKVYTGEALTQNITVEDTQETVAGTLVEGTDYEVSYQYNTDATTDTVKAVVTITGMGNYTGSIQNTFEISKADNAWDEALSIQGWTYGDTPNEPSATTIAGDAVEVTYKYFDMKGVEIGVPTEATPAGTYYVKAYASASANYNALESGRAEFVIAPKSITAETVTVDELADVTYSGDEFTPEVVVKDSQESVAKTLVKGTDYTVSYKDNVNAGTAAVTITGIGNYADSTTITFTINKKSIDGAALEGILAQTYDGTDKTQPGLVVKVDGKTIDPANYEVTYANNVNAGENTATVTVTAVENSNYTGTVSAQFTILKADNAWTQNLTMYGWVYGADANTPSAAAKVGEVYFKYYTDSECTEEMAAPTSETAVGTYYVKAFVSYTEEETANYNELAPLTKEFVISARNIASADEAGNVQVTGISNKVFTGDAQTQSDMKVYVNGVLLSTETDYDVDYKANVNVGTATLTIRAKQNSNYTGLVTRTFEITPAQITGDDVTGVIDKEYTGSPITQSVVVTVNGTVLELDKDYTTSYTGNTNVGEATVVVTGTGNYAGTVVKTFNITQKSIKSVTLEGVETLTYSGSELTQDELVVKDGDTTLVEGVDYRVEYANNINASDEATLTIIGLGNYKDSIEQTFKIEARSVADAKAVGFGDLVYTGSEVKHDTDNIVVSVDGRVLDPATDYVLVYGNNTNVGEATVTIQGTGNYKDTCVIKFMISEYANEWTKELSIAGWTYGDEPNAPTAAAKFGTATYKYFSDEDCENQIAAPTETTAAGTYYVKAYVVGTTNYTGLESAAVEFVIATKSIKDADLTIIGTETYDGTPQTKEPAQIIVSLGDKELVAGTDYEVSYKDNVDAGTATAVITGIGNYADEISGTFQIEQARNRWTSALTAEGWTYGEDANEPSAAALFGTPEYTYYTDSACTDSIEGVPTEAGTYYVKATVAETGNYTGLTTNRGVKVVIDKADNAWTENLSIKDWTYGDEPNAPSAAAKVGEATYKYFSDAACQNQITDPTAAGTYYVKAYVAESANYNALESMAVSFTILPAGLPDASLEYNTVVYSGSANTPAVTIDGLTEGVDFTVEYVENTNVNVGTATVVIQGIGNYDGTIVETFQITKASLTVTVKDAAKVYGTENPAFDVTYSGFVGSDTESSLGGQLAYTCLATPLSDVGTYAITASGLTSNNYDIQYVAGTLTVTQAELTDAALAYVTTPYIGEERCPIVSFEGLELFIGHDFTVEYKDNVNVGTATATIKGIGNYKGEIVKTFQITPATVTVKVADATKVYGEANPEFTVSYEGFVNGETKAVLTKEATAACEATAASGVGTYHITVSGAEAANYTFQYVGGKLTVVKADNEWTTELSINDWIYGEYDVAVNAPIAAAKDGEVTFKYFKVTVGDSGTIQTTELDGVPTEVGLYAVKAYVAASANYNALESAAVDFNISPKPLNDEDVEVTGIVDKTYTGEAQTQSGLKVVVNGVTLVEGKDIIVSYENNVAAGTATVTINAAQGSNYTESITETFVIEPAQLPTALLEYNSVMYDGNAKTPTVSIVGLEEGKDFTVDYANNVEVGTATVTVTGTGNYAGTQTLTFQITEVPVVMYTVTFDTLGGSEIAPITVEEGSEVILPAAPARAGYDFLGWAMTADAKEAAYQPGDTIVVTEDITVYAVWEANDVIRIYGATRYQTAMGIVEQMKEERGIDKFNTMILATGEEFADALSGSYLSYVKDAPILLLNEKYASDVTAFVNANLTAGGKVYVLGGTTAVPESWLSGLATSNVERLGGATRYETNIEILKEAGVTSGDILVCTGTVFADSLSASAVKKPIFLVGETLRDSQKEYLSSLTNERYHILGGTNAIPTEMRVAVGEYGRTYRIGGATRYETSVMVAERFIKNPESVVVAYAWEFPDGLCGGLLAINANGPVILASDSSYGAAAGYVAEKGIDEGYVLGGDVRFTDEAITDIFGIDADDIKVRYME